MKNYTGCHVQFVKGGREYFKLLTKLIDEAVESIQLQTYIFNNDETGTQVANALMKAAGRQVKVYLLADGYASQGLPSGFIKEMQNAGIHFRFFEPIFTSKHFYFGRRLHHKVVVIDRQRSLVGGMNIADRYNDLPEQQAWFDAAFYVEGTIAGMLSDICTSLWNNEPSRKFKKAATPPPEVNNGPEKVKYPVRIRRNDWVKRQHEVRKTYSEFFREAEKSITIVCSYFLPGKLFRRQLRRALARGVSVRVVLTGLSDIKTAKFAERFLYRWMLRNGIELYEYQPTVLHAKMAIVDKKKITLGSYNINNISEFVSIELNLDVNSKDFVEKINDEIEAMIEKDCVHIEPSSFTTNPVTQFVQWSSFQFVRLMLTLTTFYFRQEE